MIRFRHRYTSKVVLTKQQVSFIAHWFSDILPQLVGDAILPEELEFSPKTKILSLTYSYDLGISFLENSKYDDNIHSVHILPFMVSFMMDYTSTGMYYDVSKEYKKIGSLGTKNTLRISFNTKTTPNGLFLVLTKALDISPKTASEFIRSVLENEHESIGIDCDTEKLKVLLAEINAEYELR